MDFVHVQAALVNPYTLYVARLKMPAAFDCFMQLDPVSRRGRF